MAGKGKTALITGASGGIGLELARVFGAEGYDLIVVARSADQLEKIRAEFSERYKVGVRVLTKDLAQADAPQQVYDELRGTAIDVLVNNAGFATYGKFVELDAAKDMEEVQLNVVALTHLTKLFLPDMVARGSGKVLNVASTASFQPGPLMAVYYATKAYVLSLSEALANETKGTGVTVTALCPGPTQTGFQSRADMEKSRLFQYTRVMNAATVARAGYDGLMRGKTVVIPGISNQMQTFLIRFVPRNQVTQLVRRVQESSEH